LVPQDAVADRVVLGEPALDGSTQAVSGILPTAIAAAGQHLICPAGFGAEAAWAAGCW
jgi:predicted ATPase with chaperone activity